MNDYDPYEGVLWDPSQNHRCDVRWLLTTMGGVLSRETAFRMWFYFDSDEEYEEALVALDSKRYKYKLQSGRRIGLYVPYRENGCDECAKAAKYPPKASAEKFVVVRKKGSLSRTARRRAARKGRGSSPRKRRRRSRKRK